MRPFLKLLVIGLAMGVTAAAQDPASVGPKNYKVEIDNQWVRVLRLRQGPHENTPMYEEPATVEVFLTDAHQKFTGSDGRAREATHKAGDVSFSEAVKQTEQNLSEEPLEAVIVELKPGASRDGLAPAALDPVKVDPKHHTVPFENDRVRVLRTVLEPHLKGPLHAHPHYVVVYMTVLHTTMTLADGKTVDNPRQPGDIAWRDAYQHITENIGDKTAVEIQIEIK
jgi:quercetin dioxygenase-like cupin family protein